MSNHKFKSMKSKTCYRLIPSLMYIIAVTAVVLTMFFMFVLQTGNSYAADDEFLDDILNGDNGDLPYDIIHGKLDDNADANSKVTHTELEDNDPFPSTPKSPIPNDSHFATFMLKKTINPTTNNHIKTNHLRNVKAYKIISKEPIMENSLVKIVMAPQNVLEKLSKQHGNLKYAGNKIDENANGPIKYDDNDVGVFDQELIQRDNGMDDVDISKENNEIFDAKKIVHQASNNIQVIAKIDKKRLKNVNSVVRTEIATHAPLTEVEKIHDEQQMKLFNVGVNSLKRKIELTTEHASPTITTYHNIEDVHIDDDTSILSDPTQFSALENVDLESSNISENSLTEITESDTDLKKYESSLEHLEKPTTDSSLTYYQEHSTNDDFGTQHFEDTITQATHDSSPLPPDASDQLSTETIVIPKATPTRRITRPTTTTVAPVNPKGKKEKKIPKKVNSVESISKYKKFAKLDDDSINDFTPQVSLFELEPTDAPPQSVTKDKSKNTKRAVGDEGTFSSIVRPSPNFQNAVGDWFKNESSAERANRLQKSMTRLMHFVNVVGQVDSYLTKRFRSGLKNVVRMLESDEETRRGRSHFD